MKKVICIVGPTASGKTELSIKLAKHYQTEIINADSVQLYQELNIGSAKITEREKQGIIHHLLDITSLDQNYTIFHFQTDARKLIESISIPIFVGGSGLYLKSVLYDYLLEEQQQIINANNYEEIKNKLKKLDPDLQIDWENERRVISAYKQAVNGSLRSLKQSKDRLLYDVCIIYLDLDREQLKQRLIKRLDLMIDQGLIEETNKLVQSGYELNVIGYKQIKKYLQQQITLDQAKSEIITASMKFAKRQKTWFLNQMQVYQMPALSNNLYQDCLKLIDNFLGV